MEFGVVAFDLIILGGRMSFRSDLSYALGRMNFSVVASAMILVGSALVW
jgi:hypothetical protein